MNNIFKYGLVLLFLVALSWFFYDRGKKDEKQKHQFEEIEVVRKSLLDSIAVIKENTITRDSRLKEAIKSNIEILDTLNATLKKVNRSSERIENRIAIQKAKLDSLWKNIQ